MKGRSGLAGVDIKLNLAEVRKEARKPLYAYVGAGDYAVEQMQATARGLQRGPRELPTARHLGQHRGHLGRQGLPHRGEDPAHDRQGAPDLAQASLTELSGKANELYGDFVQRGERLVTTIRRQPATKKAVARPRPPSGRPVPPRRTPAARATASKAAADAAASKVG